MLNEFYQNIGIKGFINRYGLCNALRRGLFTANPVHYIKSYEIKKILWQEKASKKIEKYMKYWESDPEGLAFSDAEVHDPIWVYWNKGIENAPDIVKSCYESLKRFGTREVILLTKENLSQYLQMPSYVEDKKTSGGMPLAIYTDLVRLALLEHYGGTWIDATVYLTARIPEEIFSSDFFAFQNTLGLLDNPALYAVWFMHAKAHGDIITKARNVAFAYWKKENHLFEYLTSNLIITQVVSRNPMAIENIPYLNSDYSEYLIKVLGEDFSEEKWKWICSLTGIHKLTYKLDAAIDKAGSFYNYIVHSSDNN